MQLLSHLNKKKYVFYLIPFLLFMIGCGQDKPIEKEFSPNVELNALTLTA